MRKSTKSIHLPNSFAVLSRPAAVDLSSRTLRYATDLLRQHRSGLLIRQKITVSAHTRDDQREKQYQ